MNCEPGDLACVVRFEVRGLTLVPPEIVGSFVTVTESFPGSCGMALWSIERPLFFIAEQNMKVLNSNQVFLKGESVYASHLPDAVLQPIRKLPVGSLTQKIKELKCDTARPELRPYF